ncbi:unnamed protein product [Adineta steineri]|uniref:Uncharacterized protein n=3 Tax=Adineta steineri TaxID=433720 RepID=A0A814MV83_9BILA|nr:unnamed protein product [Adineta steineri]CAF1510978.1 unnamed protein product [Adineta steineri]CAF3750210.1 unnamed protein product [Adineta steineri]CAF4210734.1 unnamed protein product [Adineta steineri]
MWITIAWLILASFPKTADAGPLAFAACASTAGGGICGTAVTVALPFCASAILFPPAWAACMAGVVGTGCTAALVGCVAVFFLPTP